MRCAAILNLVAAALWIVSGVLWVGATYVSRRALTPEQEKAVIDSGQWVDASWSEDGKDLFDTAKRQVKWNRYAAFAAAAAAILQGTALALPFLR